MSCLQTYGTQCGSLSRDSFYERTETLFNAKRPCRVAAIDDKPGQSGCCSCFSCIGGTYWKNHIRNMLWNPGKSCFDRALSVSRLLPMRQAKITLSDPCGHLSSAEDVQKLYCTVNLKQHTYASDCHVFNKTFQSPKHHVQKP